MAIPQEDKTPPRRAMPRDIFGDSIPLPGGGHVDCLLSPEELDKQMQEEEQSQPREEPGQ